MARNIVIKELLGNPFSMPPLHDKLRTVNKGHGGQDVQKDLRSRTRRDKAKGKTQERMERGSRKRSSSVGSEKMEGVGGR